MREVGSDEPAEVGSVDSATLEVVERWAGESIVPVGEDPAAVITPGTAWGAAFAAAEAEIAAGRLSPSPEWQRDYALLFGLQRMLSDATPHLKDGLALREHQVDALAGMFAALLGDAQRGWKDQSGPDENGGSEQAEEQRSARAPACAWELVSVGALFRWHGKSVPTPNLELISE